MPGLRMPGLLSPWRGQVGYSCIREIFVDGSGCKKRNAPEPFFVRWPGTRILTRTRARKTRKTRKHEIQNSKLKIQHSMKTSPAAIKNPTWSVGDVHGQYSYRNPHADLYLYLSQWSDMESYLNVGYSRPGQYHLHVNTHLRLINRLADGLLDLHARGPHTGDRRLLDIASGRGGAAIHARRRYGLHVTGVDITPYNAWRATQNARDRQVWPNVRFSMGNSLRLPLPAASFPLVWSIESPAHFPDKPVFLREAARVLKPGGAFTFADLLVVEEVAAASEENRQIYADFLRVWDVPYLESFDSYRRAIAEAGLELRRAEIVTRCNLDILNRDCAIFLWLSKWPWLYRTYARYLKWRTGANLDNVYEHVLASHRALRLGMIDYGLFWAVKPNST
ncbi:MAG: class I SAM-dependent methyltransferase [Chloroflexi bacterium]|nr:MAG: class I SAM-dependent methyltransferase [Chloroflexota bacterium]